MSSSYPKTDPKDLLTVTEKEDDGFSQMSGQTAVDSDATHRSMKRRFARWTLEKCKSHSKTYQSYKAITTLPDNATEEQFLAAAAIRAPKLVQGVKELGGVEKAFEAAETLTEATAGTVAYSELLTYQRKAIRAQNKRIKALEPSSGFLGIGKGKSRQQASYDDTDIPLTEAELSMVKSEVIDEVEKVRRFKGGEAALIRRVAKDGDMSKAAAKDLLASLTARSTMATTATASKA